MQRTIGIDLAIRGDQVAQIFDDGTPVGPPIRFRLTPEDLDGLVAKAREDLPECASVQALMEPTGMSWFPVAHRLSDAGITPIRVKGQRVQALRRYLSEHAKTDAADAHLLGVMPVFGSRGFDPIHIPGPKGHALQRLTKQRRRLMDDVSAAKRRLIDLIRWAAPELEKALPDMQTRLALACMREWFDPKTLLAARRPRLRRFIAQNASGNHPHSGPFVETLIDNLRAAARAALALHHDHVSFTDLQAEIGLEVGLMEHRLDAIVTLDRRIRELYRDLHPEDVLQTVPGIGRTLAPVLLGVFHTADRFRSERHMRGFCGLFPRQANSGGREKPGQRLTQAGNDRIKQALYLAADAARRIDPGLAEVYWRLMTVKGHHHKQAICAVANRLVNRVHRVLRTGKPYELRDTDGQSVTVAEAKTIIARRYTVPTAIRDARRVTEPVLPG
jgi:transposase